jgi:hypothetical protein
MKTLLRPLFSEISAEYRIGNQDIDDDAISDLAIIFRRFQAATAKQIVKFDIREIKQENQELLNAIQRRIAQNISNVQVPHNRTSIGSIFRTLTRLIQRVTGLAIAEQWTEREATVALNNYLAGEMIRISSTEAQFIVEATREAVVIEVTDPLTNSIRRIADLFKSGNNSEARALARQVDKLARLPLSETQGRIVAEVGKTQAELISAEAQARAVQSLEQLAQESGSQLKEWNAVFVRTREPHAEADGQKQPISDPFLVGGELLFYPGDGSLGASLWNIINCQCSADFL